MNDPSNFEIREERKGWSVYKILYETFSKSSKYYAARPKLLKKALKSSMAYVIGREKTVGREHIALILRIEQDCKEIICGAAILELPHRFFPDPKYSNAKGLSQSGFIFPLGHDKVVLNPKIPPIVLDAMQSGLYLHWRGIPLEHSRKGHGRALLAECLRRAEERNESLVLSTDSVKACRFYHREGLYHLATHTYKDRRWDVFGVPSPTTDLEAIDDPVYNLENCQECATLRFNAISL